ncbi:MAG: hypothetical protein IAF58_17885, partial [Leptolyngbya sp.]|nr:hypothetical protein [Candidatus Melainabacteria bacterium]
MELKDALTIVREEYVDTYKKVLSEYRAQSLQVTPEVAFKLKGVLSIFMSVSILDAVVQTESGEKQVCEIQVNPKTLLENLQFEITPAVELTWERFEWNAAEFLVENYLGNDVKFTNWCQKWLHLEGQFAQDEDGLSGIVHSISLPTLLEGKTVIGIDFGSAPIGAFIELLPLLAESGNIHVKSGMVEVE